MSYFNRHRNLFPPNIVQATMFQYRTHLEMPPNVTADMGNGTKIKISELTPDDRNKFTISKFTITDYEGREG